MSGIDNIFQKVSNACVYLFVLELGCDCLS